MTVQNRNGAWVISDIVDGYLVTRTYIFNTKAEAIELFKQDLKQGN